MTYKSTDTKQYMQRAALSAPWSAISCTASILNHFFHYLLSVVAAVRGEIIFSLKSFGCIHISSCGRTCSARTSMDGARDPSERQRWRISCPNASQITAAPSRCLECLRHRADDSQSITTARTTTMQVVEQGVQTAIETLSSIRRHCYPGFSYGSGDGFYSCRS